MLEEKKKSNIDDIPIPKIDIEEYQKEEIEDEVPKLKSLGWDKIDEILEKVYKDLEPLHFGNISPINEKKLKGISVYEVGGKNPHWHFVTYGLTELYEKENNNLDKSGYGFELTFRLSKTIAQREVPNWAINFLNNIANYIFKTQSIFNVGHYLNTNGPIISNVETEIKAITFTEDSVFKGEFQTPNGKIKFLQVVGITIDELDAMISWDPIKVLELLKLPLNITNVARKTMLSDEDRRIIEKGIEQDGSSTRFLYVDILDLDREYRNILTLGALSINNFRNLLKSVVLKSVPLTLYADYKINFLLSMENNIEEADNGYNIYLKNETVKELINRLEPKAQMMILDTFDGLDIIIKQSYIKDRYGNVIEVIG